MREKGFSDEHRIVSGRSERTHHVYSWNTLATDTVTPFGVGQGGSLS